MHRLLGGLACNSESRADGRMKNNTQGHQKMAQAGNKYKYTHLWLEIFGEMQKIIFFSLPC